MRKLSGAKYFFANWMRGSLCWILKAEEGWGGIEIFTKGVVDRREEFSAIKLQRNQFFLFQDLKRFSDVEWLCLPRFPNCTLKIKTTVILICYCSFTEMPWNKLGGVSRFHSLCGQASFRLLPNPPCPLYRNQTWRRGKLSLAGRREVGLWNERVREKRCVAVDWERIKIWNSKENSMQGIWWGFDGTKEEFSIHALLLFITWKCFGVGRRRRD